MIPQTKPRPPQISPEEFLSKLPEHQRPFFRAAMEGLPTTFTLSQEGIASKAQGNARPAPLCSPLRVKAISSQQDTKGWSSVVELLNPDGDVVECVLPWRIIDGKPRDAIAILADHGVRIFNQLNKDLVLVLIRNWNAPTRQIEIDRVGWTANFDAFVLTSGRVLTRDDNSTRYRFEENLDAKEVGNLGDWRNGVAGLSIGNTNMIFAIALAFSTCMLPFTNLNSLIFHFFGKTSRGKTRVLRTALSVWPKIGKDDKTWDATINGLEGELSRSNHILLGLDELPKDASDDLGNKIYKASLGTGKARSEKDGSAKKRALWSTSVISTGERSGLATLKGIGKTPTGGQGVRMIDIPADGEHGIFDHLHGHATSDAFVKVLDKAIQKSSGAAGAAFVSRLLKMDPEQLKRVLEKALELQVAGLYSHLGIVPGDDKTVEIRRVLDAFAFIAVAGEWATECNITGWSKGMTSEAVKTVATRWLVGRGRMPLDQSEALKQVRDYLARIELGFVPIADVKHIPKGEISPPGYRDDVFFFVLPQTLSLLSGDKGVPTALLNYLLNAEYLEKGNEKDSLQFRMGPIISGRPRVYRIRRTILDFDGI
jgi:putative DNA primase/helicase